MRRAKLNAKAIEILATLSDNSDLDYGSDDSDADRTWHPQKVKIIGASDFSDSGEEDIVTENEPVVSTSGENQTLSPSSPLQQQMDQNPLPNATILNTGWTQKSFIGKPLPGNNFGPYLPINIRTPFDYVKTYLSDKHFEEAALYTNMYVMSKTGKELKTTANEMQIMYGVHAMMSVFKYPRFKMYWDSRGMGFGPISQAITRDRFLKLRSCLHYVDINNRPAGNNNRFWKVQPIIDQVRNACRNIPRLVDCYSVDEQMIPFTGRCPSRQYVKNKPRPTGLKNFVITTSKGKVIDFEIYQGVDTPFQDKSLGLGPAVVLHLSQSIPQGSVLFFDRYFTTVPLLDRLLSEGLMATGTIISNRLRNVHFSQDKKFQRGVWEEFTRCDNQISATKWKDSKCVTLISNATGAEPYSVVKRWSKTENKEIEVPCPDVVKSYNQYMGGVDICDQQMECYRTWIKSRKWTLKVALHFIDLSIVNAWMEYREDAQKLLKRKNEIMDLMNFKIAVAREWLTKSPNKRALSSEESNSSDTEENQMTIQRPQNYRAPVPPTNKVKDGFEHWPEVCNIPNPKCCRMKGCKSRSRIKCTKCDIYLCLTAKKNCFTIFHKT